MVHSVTAFLNAKVWWPLFPVLLLLVVIALSAAIVLVVKRKASKTDVVLQVLTLVCYLFTAVVAMASEGGTLSPHVHRLPSLVTQALLLAQLVRIWHREGARPLRTLNLIAWGGILADTALHFLVKPE
ncbi:MAG: hypothetical protein D4R81_05270 [Nitrospiraceae bacterium]|nr:MAG: hypothetical protein D4R81_05270 [Nitrospiraceae bacterium]